jgi:hypothetical protein
MPRSTLRRLFAEETAALYDHAIPKPTEISPATNWFRRGRVRWDHVAARRVLLNHCDRASPLTREIHDRYAIEEHSDPGEAHSA